MRVFLILLALWVLFGSWSKEATFGLDTAFKRPTAQATLATSEFRKILVSVKFVSAILGPEMAAPILWTHGKMPFFCRKTSMSIKILVLGGGGSIWVFGGGECRFYFYGREDFSDRWPGDSQCKSGRLARFNSRESIRRKKPIPRESLEAILVGHYHSFRNHYISSSKTIKSCNCNCR